MDRADIRRALLDLRVALDDVDAVADDMLRPPGQRDLGPRIPRIHARNYRDAHRKMEELLTYLLRAVDSPPPDSGPTTH